jgi:hypothetical protein
MARFSLQRDIDFFKAISRELVDDVIQTSIIFYKLVIEDTKTNLYGESLSKTYYSPIETTCIIERDNTSLAYENGFGYSENQNVEFRFNKFTLDERGFLPEVGDIIFHNKAYFEVDNVVDRDQLIGGQDFNDYSVIVSTFMTNRSGLQIEERVV